MTSSKHDLGDVIVVEDDPDFRNLVVNQLRRAGYQVVALSNGFAAATYFASAQLRNRQPAAIVSDIRMPGFDGLHLLAAVREASWTSPVILMTGFGLSDRETPDRLDAAAVLSKPFDIGELQELLDAVVGVPFGVAGGSA